ncbi:MAG: Maf family protein [Candidatus Eisenbacteria bacterium]|nr:Maf family protein [Candidatus Eisenbacteria bacterium]
MFISPPRKRMVLASGSPRRRELVKMIGLEFELAVPEIHEDSAPHARPSKFVVELALAKALSLAQRFPNAVILGADTVVVLDGRILGKPRSVADARRMLRALSGRTHVVYTGLALVDVPTGVRETAYEKSRVTMKNIGNAEIDDYLATGEPMDKAGSYGIQGFGAVFIKHINGCFFNVMGLPVARLYDMLRELSEKLGR